MSNRHSDVLLELSHIRQDDPPFRRRCFTGAGVHLNTWEDGGAQIVRFRINFGNVAVTWAGDQGFRGYQVEEGGSMGVGYKSSAMLFNLRQIDLAPIAGALSQALVKSTERALRGLAIQQVNFVLEKMKMEISSRAIVTE